MGVAQVPKHLFYSLQQISTNEVNVRILFDISINHYESANVRKLMHLQTMTETLLPSRNHTVSGFILYQVYSPTSFTSIISVLNKHTLIREHHKGIIAISGPLLNSLGTPNVGMPVLL